MKLFNPTLELIKAAFDGVPYYIGPGQIISVSDMVGSWIMEREAFKGLVELNVPPNAGKKFDLKTFIGEKTIQGLDRYVENLQDNVIESYIRFDSEMKTNNQFGSELRGKGIKKALKNLETATSLIKDLEVKFGLSIARKDYQEKTTNLMQSIEAAVAEFEADADSQEKARNQETEMDKQIRAMLPKEVLQATGH
jgi:hypothetical protein